MLKLGMLSSGAIKIRKNSYWSVICEGEKKNIYISKCRLNGCVTSTGIYRNNFVCHVKQFILGIAALDIDHRLVGKPFKLML